VEEMCCLYREWLERMQRSEEKKLEESRLLEANVLLSSSLVVFVYKVLNSGK